MIRGCLLMAGWTALAGCSSGPPKSETRRYPVLTFRQEFVKVKETTRISMRAARFPIEAFSDSGFEGPVVEDRGFSWRFGVVLGRSADSVSVSPSLHLVRDASFQPVRGALRNMGRMGLEDQRSTALRSNPEAYSRDREAMERHDPDADREARIRDLESRVRKFLKDLQERLGSNSR